MEKRIVFVLGADVVGEELKNLLGLKISLGQRSTLIQIESTDPHEILVLTLEIIRSFPERERYNTLVLYELEEGGDLLNANLPCDKLDLKLLLKKISEAVGGYDTPQQKEMARALYAGAVTALIN